MSTLKKIALAALGSAAGYSTWRWAENFAEARRNANAAKGKRIIILGAGFGGQAVASELARLLPAPSDAEITLIDEDNFLLFTPMLTEAAGGELDPRHIAVPVRQLPKRIRFVQGSVQKIDLASRSVTLRVGSDGIYPAEIQLRADHLVIALGSVTNFHHVPGVAEHSLGVKRLEDASAICDRVLSCLERASIEDDADRRKALLTFVVAGGGYTGVETMAAVNDLVRDNAAQYQIAGDAAQVRTILINPEGRLLSETSAELAAYAQSKLQEHGVDVRLNATIKGASADSVELKSGERIPTRTLIWAAGVMPNPAVSDLSCEKGKHGVKVNSCCQLESYPGIWALGDCAEIPNPTKKNSATYAPTAQNATREGVAVARNIVRSFRGVAPQPFVYEPIGELALVGKHSGVARIWGVNVSGLLAWAMWRGVYLAKMPGLAQRVRVASDWTLDVLFGRDAVPSGSQTAATSASAQAKAAQAS